MSAKANSQRASQRPIKMEDELDIWQMMDVSNIAAWWSVLRKSPTVSAYASSIASLALKMWLNRVLIGCPVFRLEMCRRPSHLAQAQLLSHGRRPSLSLVPTPFRCQKVPRTWCCYPPPLTRTTSVPQVLVTLSGECFATISELLLVGRRVMMPTIPSTPSHLRPTTVCTHLQMRRAPSVQERLLFAQSTPDFKTFTFTQPMLS